MHEIEMQQMSAEFFECWTAAIRHLDNRVDVGIHSWLRAHPHPPFLEHLSFRLGNQLFFVRIEDVDRNVAGPGSMRGLLRAASIANGHACILPMKQNWRGSWVATQRDWGLIGAETGDPVDPAALVSDEKIQMTPWELQDAAVQVVRGQLEKEGFSVTNWQGSPEVDPSIWFLGKSGLEWIVVRAVAYPAETAQRPLNLEEIAVHCARQSRTGHFASVALASADQASEQRTLPLWRGYPICARYLGLEEV